MTARKFSVMVAVDIDGVLGDTQTHLLNRANAEFGIHMTKADLTGWDPKIGPSTFEELIERYLLDTDWIMSVPVISGACEGMESIRQVADVMIASTTIPETEQFRAAWVEKNFGFKPVFMNTWKIGKANVPADVLIDDYDFNLRAFVEKQPNRSGLLITQPWNQNAQPHPKIRRARDWSEITGWFHLDQFKQ